MITESAYRVKRYVEVVVDHAEDGSLTPLTIVWRDGRRFVIERVLDFVQAASPRCGCNMLRFYVEIAGKKTFLYSEGPRWFVEEKVRLE